MSLLDEMATNPRIGDKIVILAGTVTYEVCEGSTVRVQTRRKPPHEVVTEVAMSPDVWRDLCRLATSGSRTWTAP